MSRFPPLGFDITHFSVHRNKAKRRKPIKISTAAKRHNKQDTGLHGETEEPKDVIACLNVRLDSYEYKGFVSLFLGGPLPASFDFTPLETSLALPPLFLQIYPFVCTVGLGISIAELPMRFEFAPARSLISLLVRPTFVWCVYAVDSFPLYCHD